MKYARKPAALMTPRPNVAAQAAASIRAATRKVIADASADAARKTLIDSSGFKLLPRKVRDAAPYFTPRMLLALIKKAEAEAEKTPAERVQNAKPGSPLARMSEQAGIRTAAPQKVTVTRGALTIPTRTPSEIRAAKARASKAKA